MDLKPTIFEEYKNGNIPPKSGDSCYSVLGCFEVDSGDSYIKKKKHATAVLSFHCFW